MVIVSGTNDQFRFGDSVLDVDILEQRIATGRSVETRILWGPGYHFITHDELSGIADAIGLSDYWNTVARSDFCKPIDSKWQCTIPQPGDEPESLNALLETLKFK